MKKTRPFFIFIWVLSALSSCGRVETNSLGPSYTIDQFFPLGKYEWVYRADSVIYDLVGTEQVLDSTTSYLRFQMEKRGGDWFQVQSQRRDSSMEWNVVGTAKIYMLNGEVIVNQNGISLTRLVSPVRLDNQWDESALVPADLIIRVAGESIAPFSIPWEAEYVEFIDSFQVEGKTYDQIVKKVSIDEDVLIERRALTEWYGEGYGLVLAQGFFADTQCEHIPGELADCIDIPWSDKATKGYQYTLTLESFDTW